jgi:hypothetical protein
VIRYLSPFLPRYLSPCMQSHRPVNGPKCEVQGSGSGLFFGLFAPSDNADYVILCSIVMFGRMVRAASPVR